MLELKLLGPSTRVSMAEASVLIQAQRDQVHRRERIAGLLLLPGFYDDWLSADREAINIASESVIQTLLNRLAAEGR